MKIRLINMPMASVYRPSAGLRQLKAVTKSNFDDIDIKILYLNLDYYDFLGPEKHSLIDTYSHATELNEWMFNEILHPCTPEPKNFYMISSPEKFETALETAKNVKKKLRDFLIEMISKYDLSNCDIIGFTCMFSQTVASLAMAKLIKEMNSDSVIILGGANCEDPMGITLLKNHPFVDFVFHGRALDSFASFIKTYRNGTFEDLHRISNVYSKKNYSQKSTVVSNIVKNETKDLFPLFYDHNEYVDHLLVMKNPLAKDRIYFPFETSHGCFWAEKYKCTFCGLNTVKFQYLEEETATNYLNDLIKKNKDIFVNFQAVDNVIPESYLSRVVPFLDVPKDTYFIYETRSTLNYDELSQLSAKNFKHIQPGIEALSTKVLRLMSKGVSKSTNICFLRNSIELDIYPVWNYLFGFPNQTEDTYEEIYNDIDLITHLTPPCGFFRVRFDRYSYYFDNAKISGLDLQPFPTYKYLYPTLSSEDLFNISYYFCNVNYDAPYFKPVIKWTEKVNEKIDMWKSKHASYESIPKLFMQGSFEIFDSRSGEPIVHTISEKEKKILEFLKKPKKLEYLVKVYPELNNEEVSKIVNNLYTKKLLIKDNTQYLSLVCNSFGLQKKTVEQYKNFSDS